MRYVFVINPVAGKGRGKQTVVPAVQEFAASHNIEYKIIITNGPGDAREKARAEADTGDEISFFACGGEGTCFEVLNGIVGYSNVSLGVIPCGSANDFLKYFHERNAFFDINEQINGSVMPIDLIKAGDDYCINQCSLGMDAIVASDMQLFKRWPFVSGSLAYKMAVIKTFLRKTGSNIKIKIDGKIIGEKDCLFAVCANGPVYGGGYVSAPKAVPNDGMLEYLIVEKVSKLKIPGFLKLYREGTHEGLSYCTSGKCKTMELETEKQLPVNLDGELAYKQHIVFELAKEKLNFILPASLSKKLLTNLKQ